MAVKTKYYFLSPEAWSITDGELAHVTVMLVTRSGTTYNVTTSASPDPSVLLCSHNVSTGEVSWGEDLPAPPSEDRPSVASKEKVSVKFKY